MSWLSTVLLLVSFAGSASDAASNVMGDWTGPTQSIVRIYPCGKAVCAKIVKLAKNSPDKTDENNPEKNLRNRPLCGLDIGTGFTQKDAAHLQDGHLYDPKNGRTYAGTITADGDALTLRGYIGISLIGRSEVWHRVAPADLTSCGV